MDRRDFLQTASLSAAALAWPRFAGAAELPFNPTPAEGWRTFELTTRVTPAPGITRVWLPLPSLQDDAWVKPMGNLWRGNAADIRPAVDPVEGAQMLVASWPAGDGPAAELELLSRFSARDRAVNFDQAEGVPALDPATLARCTAATRLIPIDGIVRTTALDITRGSTHDLDKARAIYEWVVENTERNPRTRGCGLGDIRFMLETGDLTGKCADLNALYVGLARAVGLPARDLYGIRVADSRFGYKCLGKSGDVSKAQHCRAEVWLTDHGWVPVDPADVRKVVLEEKPGLTLSDEIVVAVREKLFGAWETNWLPYNTAHDVALPGSSGPAIAYLMYPQGEAGGNRLDSLDPEKFAYTITAKEIAA
ncbi:MAG TPA: transglutaminase-like domain-containing protein [Steroidobacteraceae bacterium]|nr:transglutaminase-like domain-containing protein [Steroidobacteraceae bacterium]